MTEGLCQQIGLYEFRRIGNSTVLSLIEPLRIQQQIIYPPPRLNSARSPVFAASASPAFDSLRVLRSANDVITDTGQITYSPASDENHRVLLQIVSLAGDVGRDFDVVGEAYAGYFSKR